MNIKQIKEAKKRAEDKIKKSTQEAIDEFREETGEQISYVSISFIPIDVKKINCYNTVYKVSCAIDI